MENINQNTIDKIEKLKNSLTENRILVHRKNRTIQEVIYLIESDNVSFKSEEEKEKVLKNLKISISNNKNDRYIFLKDIELRIQKLKDEGIIPKDDPIKAETFFNYLDFEQWLECQYEFVWNKSKK